MRESVPIVVILFVVASAWAQKVSYNFDSQADFSKYKTFRWEQHPNSANIDDLTKQELGTSLNAELAEKGLAFVSVVRCRFSACTRFKSRIRSQKEFRITKLVDGKRQ